MKLLSLRYYVTVAEHLNFTKAAEYLFVSQPTLSRLMMELEDELGVTLFTRVGRGLELTESGELLYQEAKKILDLCDNLKTNIQPRTDSHLSLRIGYQAYLDLDIMDRSMIEISREHPDIDIALYRSTPAQLPKQLSDEELDLIFIIYTCVKDFKDIESIHFQKNTLQVAVPEDHPLAARDSVSIKDLAGEKIVMLERKISPPTVDFFIQQCIRNGFSPHASDYVTDIETGLRLVKLGKGITILNTARSVQVPEGIRVLNIEEVQSESDLDYVAAFKRDNPNPAIPLFVSKIMSLTEWSST